MIRLYLTTNNTNHPKVEMQLSVWVKMAGYWFMDRDGVEVHKLAKKNTRPTSSHLDRTSVVNKGFILWLSGKFFLPKFFFTRVANHSAGFDFSCPLTDLAIQ